MSEKEVPYSIAQWIIMRFLVSEAVKMSEILTKMCTQFCENTLLKTQVYDWCFTFHEGREQLKNEPHKWRLWTSWMKNNICQLYELIVDNQHIHARDIANELEINVGNVEMIIYTNLYNREKCAAR